MLNKGTDRAILRCLFEEVNNELATRDAFFVTAFMQIIFTATIMQEEAAERVIVPRRLAPHDGQIAELSEDMCTLDPPAERTVPIKSARLVKLLTQSVFQIHLQFYKLQWAKWENHSGTVHSIGLAAGDVIKFLSSSPQQGQCWLEGLIVSVDNYRNKKTTEL